jgi:uncharacterized protein YjbI with pentapeptide repeats
MKGGYMAAVEQDLSGQGQREDRDLHQGNGKPEWKDGEYRLRKHEIRSGWVSVVVQFLVAAVALGTVVIALRATNAAREAVDTAREGIERQATEARLSTAIGAIGGDQPGGRVGGLALLRRHVDNQLSAANSDEEGSEEKRLAALLYTAALDVLENYLRNPPDDPVSGGLGYGVPNVPSDNVYAAEELQGMMTLRSKVKALDTDSFVGVDLAKVQLRGQPWEGVDFSWLDGHYFLGIDLRGANLRNSIWGTSSLQDAFLQCADLDGAKLIGTDLRGADLRGANISGADFTGAQLGSAETKDEINLDHAYYAGDRRPKGLRFHIPRMTQFGDWGGTDECMTHRELDAD